MNQLKTNFSNLFYLLLILLFSQGLLTGSHASDQLREEQPNKNEFGAFPLLFYSDETGFALGGGLQIVTNKQNERYVSSVGIAGIYTWKKQYLFSVTPEMYLNEDSYKFTGTFGYSYFPNTFFGIGNDTKTDDEENYTSRLFRINPVIQKKVLPNLYFGIQYDYLHGKILKTETGGMMENGLIPGSEGGGVSGMGINLTWDSRDNNLYPVSGGYHQLIVSSFGPTLGSDFTYTSWLVDLRQYFQVFDQHIIAFQGVTCINEGRPSFLYLNEVSSLGKYLRGYNQTRFVDKNVVAFQTEYRMPLGGRFGLVAFAGFGQVTNKIKKLEFRDFKPSGGLGLRFALIPSQKVNLRIDLGIGKDDSSLDLNLMESF